MSAATKTVGEVLIDCLVENGVTHVFGIPGVHTVELYRGLEGSPIRHVTPRHEQGAGFMADGYARVSGKPGVSFVITGPGLTNTITAMAQARQDSVPMLVISGVNARATLGRARGHLHELPDQRALIHALAIHTHTLMNGADLPQVMARAFATLSSGRPGPVHIEIPTDVMAERIDVRPLSAAAPLKPHTARRAIEAAAALCCKAKGPVILAGGGVRRADAALRSLAERLDAPVVLTTNARGLMTGHPLTVPASPSLKAVRDLIAAADTVIAVGTELGPTDYDMYEDGGFPALRNLIRIDIDAATIAAGEQPAVALLSDAEAALRDLSEAIRDHQPEAGGARRAASAREAARQELPEALRTQIDLLHAIVAAMPDAILVGDSTQLVYAGNMLLDAPRPASWFNSATGYGALGYAPPAAIGAALAAPERPVIAIVGDGGLQFSLAELGTAVDEKTPVIFLVWNNHGYREIETYMKGAGIAPVGVEPSPPDFAHLAKAYGLGHFRTRGTGELVALLRQAREQGGAAIVEFVDEAH